MSHRPKSLARKPFAPKIVLPVVALVLLAIFAVVERPAWLTLKPATGTATAMAAASDLDGRR